MKIAIAGPGGIARYLIDELPKHGHALVILTRSPKPALSLPQFITDYSVPSLAAHLHDCDAAICCIDASSPSATAAQLALLEACKQSPTCKRLIPSVWGGNVADVPDQPLGAGAALAPVLAALRAQSAVAWTAVCGGWLADYLLPPQQRHLHDIGARWVQDHERSVFTLYGLGTQALDLTAARDVAAAVAALLAADDARAWEEFSCVSGTRTTWRGLWESVSAREPGRWTLRPKSLAESIGQLVERRDEASVGAAMYEIMGHSEALALPEERVRRQRERFFPGVRFRGLGELMDDAAARPGEVV